MKGHSCRGGRSRCTAKRGPGSRAHKSKAIRRQEAIRLGEVGSSSQSVPGLREGVSPFAEHLPRSVVEPVITWRKVGGKTVAVADYSGGLA